MDGNTDTFGKLEISPEKVFKTSAPILQKDQEEKIPLRKSPSFNYTEEHAPTTYDINKTFISTSAFEPATPVKNYAKLLVPNGNPKNKQK